MRVDVKLFAQLRDRAGQGDLPLDLAVPSGAVSVADVWRALVGAHPQLSAFESSVSCAVNAQYARMTTTVRAGDEVAFLPPVSGG